MKLKDSITTKFMHKGICNHCMKFVKNEFMWAVDRYNEDGSYDTWYYSKECLPDKIDVLFEIDADSNPFGIFPYEPIKIKDKDNWTFSESDVNISSVCDYEYLPNLNKFNSKTKKRTRLH